MAEEALVQKAFVIGVGIAGAVTQVFAATPAALLDRGDGLLLGMVSVAAIGPVFSYAMTHLTGTADSSRAMVAIGAGCAGAACFDGLAIAFAPGLYGQKTEHMVNVGASLLFGLSCVGVSGYLMYGRQ